MSFEGRMGMPGPAPASAPKPKIEKNFSSAKQANESVAHSPGEEFETTQAQKFLNGLTTPQELAIKFGPGAMEAIIKRAQKLGNEDKTVIESNMPPHTIFPKIPHPLHAIIPVVLSHYTEKNRTEEDEQEFTSLLDDLKKDEQFRKILEQYNPLIELYPDYTETYEMKAMKDFVELNARLSL